MKDYFVLKRLSKYEYFYFLPNGLFDLNNQKLPDTFNIINTLKYNFKFGDTLKVDGKIGIKYLSSTTQISPDIFKVIKLFKCEEFDSINVRELTREYVLEEIESFHFSLKKNPYENFLEAALISFFINTITTAKNLLGGVWSSGAEIIKKVSGGKYSTSFGYFVEALSNKNELIQHLKKKLEEYPKELYKNYDELPVTEYREYITTYSAKLEYRILQIKYKNILQDICIYAYYMTDEDKQKYEGLMANIMKALRTYPVKIINFS